MIFLGLPAYPHAGPVSFFAYRLQDAFDFSLLRWVNQQTHLLRI
jgi:hypothetical protein